MSHAVTKAMRTTEQSPTGMGDQQGTPLRAALVLLLAGCLVIGSLAGAFAQSVPPGFKMGKVTAMRHQEIQVNLKNYRLHRTVTVQDDAGGKKDLGDIRKGAFVMFHLKRGSIDRIIRVLPQ